jgi:hypothetical protein
MSNQTGNRTKSSFAAALELFKEIRELEALGLSQEEIEGYLEFYIDSFKLEETVTFDNPKDIN